MSNTGRWRLVMAGVRLTILLVMLAGVGCSAWLVIAALQENPARMPAAAKKVPVRSPELFTTREGVLDNAWLARTLELPPGVSLLELDLEKLRERVLSDPQVMTAAITRVFPDRLKVQITERMPIARVRVDLHGVQRDLLVARDGMVFFGTGFDPGMLKTLPWLDGLVMTPEDAWFRPIANMDVVARLLAEAQFSAPHLYAFWQSVSLARLDLDRELEVTMKTGSKALFTAKASFFMQLAHLDHILDRFSGVKDARVRIDLTLGRTVPVTLEAVPPEGRTPGATATASTLGFPLVSASPSKNKREL